ncbi:MAG: topoisomerase DNA-binding C4 zinc finger domain-containing protein [Clostridia bacterium]|nr:topoisomerase DNA-binding C4 zinc finger domain-containing protein [Clostridia bacterium]
MNDLKNGNTITENEHVKNIIKTQNDIQSGICPRCGGSLILRNGKYSLFYGCSNYPHCKFTKNYEN